MLTRINGLLSCEECGASVTEEMAEHHLAWHKMINDAFNGTAMLLLELRKALVEGHDTE